MRNALRSVVAVPLALLVLSIASWSMAEDPVYTAASILRGEASEDCRRCRELTACSLVRDLERGVNLRSRWYGWRPARDIDVALIEKAMTDAAFCRQYPDCRFTGNGRDLEVWSRKGWISDGVRVIAYCGAHGCTVIRRQAQALRALERIAWLLASVGAQIRPEDLRQ